MRGKNRLDVLSVGQLVADILVRPVDSINFSVDTSRVDCISFQNGGDALNVALGLRKLGASVGFAGLIGEDHAGDFLESVVRAADIDAKGLHRTRDAGTSSCVILINAKGDRTFYYYGGANEELSLEDVNMGQLDSVSLVHVGGTFTLPKLDGEGAAKLFSEARSRGVRTSMDVTWDSSGRWLPTIEPCLSYLDLFLPSIGEAKHMTGTGVPADIAGFFQSKGVRTVVVKLGEKGCYVKHGGEPGSFSPAFRTRVVDTTGAGDSFVAGFLTGVLRKWDMKECASFACAVAAMSITKVGATAGQPTFEEVRDFMESNGG